MTTKPEQPLLPQELESHLSDCSVCSKAARIVNDFCETGVEIVWRYSYMATTNKSNAVLQGWVCCLSWKKQTVLLGALRSPDNVHTLKMKEVVIWIRTHILENADPMTGFMHAALQSLPLFEHLDREFERLPLHSAHHIMLAMETIGFEHPSQEVARTAWMFYADSVRAQHLNPETRDQYESRYQDSPARKELAFS